MPRSLPSIYRRYIAVSTRISAPYRPIEMQAMIPMDERDAHLEALAAQLNASGNYRVLRRLLPRTVVTAADGTPTRTGLFIDVETTGLAHQKDEVIELAMVPFTYRLDGRLFEI